MVESAALHGRAVPAVSISHDEAAVFAVATEADQRIGIDHANLRQDRAFEMLEIGFTPAELALLPARDRAERGLHLLRFWCGKEAAAKASGGGLQGDPRKWCVVRYDTASGGLIVTNEGTTFAVETCLVDGEVVALCRLAATAHPAIVHAA
jgi:phosphopantetheinyl transferase